MDSGTPSIQSTDRRKLAAVLDIDTSQPDVFETPDTTSSTDNVTPPIPDTENENIIAKKLNSTEAYSKFQDKQLETEQSDNNTVRRKKQPAVHYEIGATGPEVVETPTEKFNRLKFEFKSFLDDLNNMKAARETAAQKGNPSEFTPFSEETYSELQHLAQSLNQLGVDPNYEAILSGKGIKYEMEQSAKLQDQITKKLISQLKAFQSGQGQSSSTAATPTATPSSANNNVVTYEVFYSNDMHKNHQASKVVALEKRITELEVLLGRNALPGSSDLVSAVDQLKEQVQLLATPNHLEILERKLKTVTQELQQFAETVKNQPPPTINEKKVNDLFELVGRWDNVATQLPALVSRLQALKTLHEESISFANTVHQLEQQQDEIKTLLKNDGELLSKVDSGLVSNMSTIQSNISVIEKRFSELSKKIEQLGLQTF